MKFLGTVLPGFLSYIPFIDFFCLFFCAVQGPTYDDARHGWCAMKVTG